MHFARFIRHRERREAIQAIWTGVDRHDRASSRPRLDRSWQITRGKGK
jgi:hypothetical protein